MDLYPIDGILPGIEDTVAQDDKLDARRKIRGNCRYL